MPLQPRTSFRKWPGALALAMLSAGLLAADVPKPPDLPPALVKPAPESIEDLKAIQEQVRRVLDKVVPATVGVRIGQGQGSGVIVSKDGYVLTAGHVSGAPGRDVTIVLPDGKTVKGKTLGMNRIADSGLIKITEERDWPFAEMGDSAGLQKGQWCVAVGHPGGYKTGRSPVVRVGRVVEPRKSFIQTDCPLVGGDSGGPLFDMHGRVIGIHSRINGPITSNHHVPVNTYKDEWERLKDPTIGEAYLGVEVDTEAKECKVAKVLPGAAADKAGLKADDVILTFDGQKVAAPTDLRPLVLKKKPNDEVAIEVRRGEETLTLKAKLLKRE